jgi:hypothetical protein
MAMLTTILTAHADVAPPETIRIFNQTVFQDHRKGPVVLKHQKHVAVFKAQCRDCHHIYENRQNVWQQGDPVQSCDTCHKQDKTPRIDKLQNAFHKNCRGCHRDKGRGPYKTCGDCHQDLPK